MIERCAEFHGEVRQAIGDILDKVGATLVRTEAVDGCRLVFRTSRRDLCIYHSAREGDINCLVREAGDGADHWTIIRALFPRPRRAIEGMAALMPDGPRSTDVILNELGQLISKLKW